MPGLKQRKLPYWIVALVVACVFFYLFPLFHIVSVKERRAEEAKAAFDPAAFVETFWFGELLVSRDKAVDINLLLAAVAEDPVLARERYSHQIGLSNTCFYFVRGEGAVQDKGEYEMSLSVDGKAGAVRIEAGPVFGNTVRDGSGLLDVNDFPNSQKFNLVSAELNKRVEQVLGKLWQEVDVGDAFTFLGCVEITNPETDYVPLRVIPVIAEKQ